MCKYPFDSKAQIFELQSHLKSITRLKISFDDSYILTAGEDGALILYENKDESTKIKLDKDSNM